MDFKLNKCNLKTTKLLLKEYCQSPDTSKIENAPCIRLEMVYHTIFSPWQTLSGRTWECRDVFYVVIHWFGETSKTKLYVHDRELSSTSTVTHRFINNICKFHILLSSLQSLSHVRLFVAPWTAARQASLSITNFRSLLRLMSIDSMMSSVSTSILNSASNCQNR